MLLLHLFTYSNCCLIAVPHRTLRKWFMSVQYGSYLPHVMTIEHTKRGQCDGGTEFLLHLIF